MTRVRSLAPVLCLVSSVLAVSVPWTFQGLDVTDDGFHLANQERLLGDGGLPRAGASNLFWLSDLMGALWLHVAGASLLHARVGWALLTALTAALSHVVLVRYFRPWPAVAAIVATCLVVQAQDRMLIDYNTVPIAFVLAAAAFLLPVAGGPPHEASAVGRPLVSGVFIALTVLARIGSLPALGLAYVAPGVRWLIGVERRRGHWRDALLSSLGSAATLAVGLLLASRGGGLHPLQEVALTGSSHSPDQFLSGYAADARAGFVLLMAFGGALAAWRLLKRLTREHSAAPATAAIVMATLAMAVGAAWISGALPRYYLVVAIALPWAVAMWQWRRAGADGTLRGYAQLELLVFALACTIVVWAGSNSGVLKMRQGLWLALPAAVLTVHEVLDAKRRRWPWAVLLSLATVAFALLMVGPYRDYPDRTRLMTSISHPRLVSIYTTPERARRVEALLQALEAHARPGETLLAFGGLPMVHFLTGTRPALAHPWPDILPADLVRTRLQELGATGALPAAAVRARVSTEHARWPLERRPPGHRESVDTIDRWLAANGYREAWSDEIFAILVR